MNAIHSAKPELTDPLRSTCLDAPSCRRVMMLSALAGGLGWGIRGQYGHETGAMIAGALVGLTLVFLLGSQLTSLTAARAAGFCAVAIGFGGSMTYGQTIGLTQDEQLIGNWAAWCWGMLGLAIKGGLWIGFAGVFLGMGLGGILYRPRELLVLFSVMLGMFFLGVLFLNSPFDPDHHILPLLYFSESWRWKPDVDVHPRREVWGGLLLALAALMIYTGSWRRDALARNLGAWSIAGGALGFPLGQCVQSFHAWNLVLFQRGILGQWSPVEHTLINWWNFMETIFGAVFAAVMGLGLWRSRALIKEPAQFQEVTLQAGAEWRLIMIHGSLLVIAESLYSEIGLVMGIIPLLGVAGGRRWPYLLLMPIVLLPIAMKTAMKYHLMLRFSLPAVLDWLALFVVPLVLSILAALASIRKCREGEGSLSFTRRALLFAVWVYFGLNFVVFQFPWPWRPWTPRTPNALVFLFCALGLSAGLYWRGRPSATWRPPNDPAHL